METAAVLFWDAARDTTLFLDLMEAAKALAWDLIDAIAALLWDATDASVA
jgi:hypothetical protein